MLGLNDKMNFVITNMKDINGKIYPGYIKLPVMDINLTSNIVSVSIFEYQEGYVIGGIEVYRLIVGEVETINDLTKEISERKINYEYIIDESIKKKLDDRLCYITDENGKKIFYTMVNDNDIVVSNNQELKNRILEVSNEINCINNSIQNIRKMIK